MEPYGELNDKESNLKLMNKYLITILFITMSYFCFGQAYWLHKEAEEYFYGTGGRTQSYEKAFWLYKKSASEGNIASLRKIGECYYNGYGVDTSKRKSYIFVKKAADCGDTTAMVMLISYYLDGEGCKKSIKRCFKYAYKAANQGNQAAIDFLQQFSCYPRREILME